MKGKAMKNISDQPDQTENEDRQLRFIDLDFKSWIGMGVKTGFERTILMGHGRMHAFVQSG